MLLTPDKTSSRTFSRWRGPARVVEVRSPHSYVIELDGVREHVHANRLKRFLVASDAVICYPDFESCVNSCNNKINCDGHNSFGCAVISNSDTDLGDIQTFEQSEHVT